MAYVYFCSAYSNDKVLEMQMFNNVNQVQIYTAECAKKGWSVEIASLAAPEQPTEEKKEVQYIPPPRWGGRVVCVETGWIFTSIATASQSMKGSQWALRKAVLRNTVYKGYHWRMYGDKEKKIDKFT